MTWSHAMAEPLGALAAAVQFWAPKILAALGILLIGWLAARLAAAVLVRALRAIGIDTLADKAKVSDALSRGAIRLTFVELIGKIVYWLCFLGAALVALQALGLTAASVWLTGLGEWIPRLIVSFVTFLFGMLIASFLGATVRAASLNAGFAHGRLLGEAVYLFLLLLAIIVALEQLQVVMRTIQAVLYILLASVGLSCALAFGLGAQDIVRRALDELVRERQEPLDRR